MAGVPQGSARGGKPYRIISAAEFGAVGAAVAPAASLFLQPVPWWEGGFNKARLTFAFNLAVAGNVNLKVIGFDTDISFSIADNMVNGNGAGLNFPAGGSALEFNFDDSVLPGNYRPVQVIPQGPISMPLNPTWNKAAFLQFIIENLSAAPLTVNSFTVSLRGN